MRATFFGFEIAKSGMQAAQVGLDVTGQNMANISTDGYSRQEVRQSTASAGVTKAKTAENTRNLAGGGVSLDGIRQIRDNFLDIRYRSAAADYGSLSKKVSVLSDVSAVLDETQTNGLNSMMEELYASLQTLSSHAGDIEFSGIVRSAAQKITKTLNQYSTRLETIVQQETEDLDTSVSEINQLLDKINQLNDTIKTETMRGGGTNELYDTRNAHLDRLADLIGIQTEPHDDGTLTIRVGNTVLLDGQTADASTVSVVTDADGSISLAYASAEEAGEITVNSGIVAGSLDMLNGKGGYALSGENSFRGIAYYQQSIDDLAMALKNTFNELNALDGEEKPLFVGDDAKSLRISDEWLADANFLTPSQTGSLAGENDNILRMIGAMDQARTISPTFTGTFEEFTLSLMLEAGTDLNFYQNLENTSKLVKATVANQRESIMGVSLNEETANLMRYQKAFEAAARFMTTLDEALDVIINRMGVVGR
jgi:flagellar hook-associated protein 1 FlgK